MRVRKTLTNELTYNEWCAKHSQRLSGLSAAEKRRRFQDYQANPGNELQKPAPKPTPSGAIKRALKRPSSKAAKELAERNITEVGAAHHALTGQMVPGVDFPEDTKDYFMGLFDPFTRTKYSPKPPSGTGQPSQSTQVFVEGTCTTGAGGVACVTFSPLGSAANDVNCVLTTASGYPVPNKIPGPGDAGVQQFTSNAPYDSAVSPPEDESTYVAARIVNAGVKMMYVGKALDRAGTVYETMNNGYDVHDLTDDEITKYLYRSSQIKSNADDWEAFSCVWSPTMTDEPIIVGDFLVSAHVSQANASHSWVKMDEVDDFARHNMAVFVTGATPGTTFHFQCIATVEYISFFRAGPPLIGAANSEIQRYSTKTYSDPDAKAIVNSSAGGTTLNVQPKDALGNLSFSSALAYLAKGASKVSSLYSDMKPALSGSDVIGKLSESFLGGSSSGSRSGWEMLDMSSGDWSPVDLLTSNLAEPESELSLFDSAGPVIEELGSAAMEFAPMLLA